MDNSEQDFNFKISQEKLKELERTHRITKVSPTQARDIEAILSNRHPLVLLEGGRDSGKSVTLYLSLAEILSGRLGKWKANILLMRNTKESARKSIFDGVLRSVLEYLEINYDDLKQKSYDRGRVTINGHQIRIDSFDVDTNNQDRLKGYKDITHVFVEELAEVTNWAMFNQLFQTIPRNFDVFWEENGVKKSKNWRGQIVCTFNTPPFGSPILNDFFDLEPSEYDGFHKTSPKSGVIMEKDYNTGEFIPHPKGLTYEQMNWHYSFSTVYDNTVLKEKLIKQGGEEAWDLYLYQQHERFRTTDPYYFLTATMGLVGSGRSGKVFTGWEQISLEEYKSIEATEFYGIDWGFSGQGDPSALTAVKHIPAKNVGELPVLYINNLLYEKGLSLPKLVDRIMQLVPNYVNSEFYIDHMPAAQSELIDRGFTSSYVHLADKGDDSRAISASYIAGNFKVKFVTNPTLEKEIEKYMWKIDREGKPTGKPTDGNDHCFVGNTLIATNKGQVEIENIKRGDFVLTRKGYQKVLKKWDNGVKKVLTYLIISNTKLICLTCTPNHKILTNSGWKEIQHLQAQDEIYQHNSLMENGIIYRKTRDTIKAIDITYTGKFGNIRMEKSQQVIMYITKIMIGLIIKLKIWNWFLVKIIFLNMLNSFTKKTQILPKRTLKKTKKNAKSGTSLKKVKLGISLITIKIKSFFTKIMDQKNVNFVATILKPKHTTQNFVATNANQLGGVKTNWISQFTNVLFAKKNLSVINLETKQHVQKSVVQNIVVLEEKTLPVFDLMVENYHEYFANGVLVHNCIDSIRYPVYTRLHPKNNQNAKFWEDFYHDYLLTDTQKTIIF